MIDESGSQLLRGGRGEDDDKDAIDDDSKNGEEKKETKYVSCILCRYWQMVAINSFRCGSHLLSDKETYIRQQDQVKNALIISYMRGFVCQVEFQSWKYFFLPHVYQHDISLKIPFSFTHTRVDADGEAEKILLRKINNIQLLQGVCDNFPHKKSEHNFWSRRDQRTFF